MNILQPLKDLAGRIAATVGVAEAQKAPPEVTEEAPHPLLGKFIIACPNEWDSMVVGDVVGFLPNSLEIPIVNDRVRGEERIVFSPFVPFTLGALQELAKLNPYERYNRLAKHSSVDAEKPRSGEELMSPEQYLKLGLQLQSELQA